MAASIFKLPVMRTAARAYRDVFSNLGFIARISWLWLLMLAVLSAIENWYVLPWSTEQSTALGLDGTGRPLDAFILVAYMVGGTLIRLPPLSSIGVPWHRFLLRGEAIVRTRPSLDSTVWSYFNGLVIVSLLPLIPIGIWVGFFVAVPPGGWIRTMSPVVVLILLALWVGCLLVAEVVAVVICARLSFILPGRALKHVPRTWRDAWEATRSLSWRLLVGTLLVAIPGYVVVSLLATWQRSDIASIVLGALLEAAAYILTFCLFTAFVSLAYQRRTSDLTQPFD
jgi:hypothetical protein